MTLNASMMGMKAYSTPLPDKTEQLAIRMEKGDLQLKEVVVKADRIRENGDTVTYRVSAFAQKQDRTIGDVLQRMPGIDVASNGKIQYQGADINKFYIEGSDLLGGKYGIATRGISHNDVGAVEVLENHQPMQVLRGLSFSDRAAVNLKLKNGAKATWVANGRLGGGWSTQPGGGLLDGELFLMAVKPGYQTITTLKTNNVGTDLRLQVTDFFAEMRNIGLNDYLSVTLPATPSLRTERTCFNRSWMLSSSHLWKLNASEVKAQVDYYNHYATAAATSVSTYYLNEGEKVITEERAGTERGNRLTGTFSVEANQKTYYLNNTFKTELDWDKMNIDMTGTVPNSQHTKAPDYYVSNNLKVIKRIGSSHLVTFTSVNEWESKPQRLYVDYSDRGGLSQQIADRAFYTAERAAYGFYKNGFKVSLEGGVAGYVRSMTGDREYDSPNSFPVQGGHNEVTTDYLSFYASPQVEYIYRKLELTLGYPFNYTYYRFNQRMGNRSEYFHAPSLSILWKPLPRFSLTVSGGGGRSPMELHDIHDEAVLSDYRTFTRGVDRFYANTRKRVSGRLQYRYPQKGFFVNMLANKSWGNIPYRSKQDFIDEFIIYSFEPVSSGVQSLNAMGSISKTLDFVDGSVAVAGGYTRMGKSIVSEGLTTRYHNTGWNIGGRISGHAAKYVYLTYGLTCYRSRLDVDHQSAHNLDRYLHKFDITVTPIKSLSWETGGEYYRNELAAGYYKNLLLLDTKVSWHIGRRMEWVASLTNILNRKIYAYTTYGTLSSFESTRYLRGRECMLTLHLKK